MKDDDLFWHSVSLDEILTKLGSRRDGLRDNEVVSRLKSYGHNAIKEKKRAGPLRIFLRQFKNFFIYILLFATFISFVLREYVDFTVIIIIILFTAILGFIQDFRAERSMKALEKLTSKKARVIRQGEKRMIEAEDVVPGDILVLERGDHIAADGRIIEEKNLRVDESPLTGESRSVDKEVAVLSRDSSLADRTNMVYTGTFVVNGNANVIVTETGLMTEIGKVAAMMEDIEEEKTPIQKKLDGLSKTLATGVVLVCAFMLVFGLMRGSSMLEMLLIVAAVSISGIPESLPAVVTVILAHGVKSMASKNAIIKKMPAVETLGAATVICTDKTGTLTENKMTVEKIFCSDDLIEVSGSGYNPIGEFILNSRKINPLKHNTLRRLMEIGTLCNNSDISKKKEEWHLIGEPTEGSLIVLGEKAGITREILKRKQPRVDEIPFDADRKFMSTLNRRSKSSDGLLLNTKGAPDVIMRRCTHMLQGGSVKKLTPQKKRQIMEQNQLLAQTGLRVLAMAYREVDQNQYLKSKKRPERLENDLVFVGLAAMKDPPRKGVKDSVQKCQEAGIKVVMITGDHRVTAKKIAEDLAILDEKDLVLTGTELDEIDDEKFLDVVDRIAVYARMTPSHKLRIVRALQSKGHIVSMTGDGVNDAPALKRADIGISMGKGGTDVAREASELVLADDNFNTIVKAIEEGRTIYSNIKKFIYYVLTGSITEVIIIFVAVLMGMSLPLTALMILFVNLVTGDFPALGLSLEKSKPQIMKQKPRPVNEGILNEFMMLRIAELVPLMTLGTISLFMWELVIRGGDLEKARTLAFVTLVLFELFHISNARADDRSIFDVGIFSNGYVNLGVLASLALTLMVVYTEMGQKIFETVALTAGEWVAIILMASSALFLMEVQKMIVSLEIKERQKYKIPTRGE